MIALVDYSISSIGMMNIDQDEGKSGVSSSSSPTLGLAVDDGRKAWNSDCFNLLCKICSTKSSGLSSSARLMAKKMLKKVCGGEDSTYHRIMDEYVFASEFLNAIKTGLSLIEAGYQVLLKGLRCQDDFLQDREALSISKIGALELVGVDGLVGEDCGTADDESHTSWASLWTHSRILAKVAP